MARNSEQLEGLLADYVDGSLDPEQMKTVEKAIAGDAQLARQLRQMKQIRGVLAGMPRAAAPSDLAEDVQSQLERNLLLGDSAGDALDPDLRISRWPQIRAMAAVVALAAGLGLLVWSMLPTTNGPSSSVAIRDLPEMDRPTARLRGSDDRAIDASNATASRDDAISGGAADNIFPPAPPQPAATNMPVPASPAPEADARGGAGSNRLADDVESPRIVWRALRAENAFMSRTDEVADVDAPEALVALAERNGADMLVLINTAAPLEANEAINGYFVRNSVLVDRVDARTEAAADEPSTSARAAATKDEARADERRAGRFWGLGEARDRSNEQTPAGVQLIVARNLTVDQTTEIAQAVQSKQISTSFNYFARLPADEPTPDVRGVYQQRAQRQQAEPPPQPDEGSDIEPAAAIDDVLLIDLPAIEGAPVSTRVRVGADGAIDVPGVGRVPVVGLSLDQIAELVQARLVQAKQNVAAGRVVVRRPALPAPLVRRGNPVDGAGAQLQAGFDHQPRVDVAIAIQPDPLTPPAVPSTQPSTQPGTPNNP